jgi:hypothetical protein
MATYKVLDKVTGAALYEYAADAPINWNEFPFTDYDHVLQPAVTATPATPNNTVITKLAFLRRFTQAERITLRGAAAQSPALADYMAMIDMAQDVTLSDPDTVAGVKMLEAAGLIAAGRTQEILNG